jgi:hypothetical protein
VIYGTPITWSNINQTVHRLQVHIVKAVKRSKNEYCGVLYGALSMLEPCEVKVSCKVLRGEGSRKAADLPGGPHRAVHQGYRAIAG